MKKIIPSIILIMLYSTVLLLYACSKEDFRINRKLELNTITTHVTTWLDEQKLFLRNRSTENIDLLMQNLDYDKFHYEELYENKRLLIIPIRKELAVKKNIDRDRIYNFVAIIDQSNKILRANVVIFKSKNASQKNNLPVNTLSRLYNSRKIGVEGQFRMVHISGNLLYLMDVKNGRPYSWGQYQIKEKVTPGISMARQPCTDYYLVITYYENGEVVDQTYQYIGKVCESATCDPKYEAYCAGEDGTGGGTSGDVQCCLPDPNFRITVDNTPSDYTMICGLERLDPITKKPTKTCVFSWTFNTNNILWYTWKYNSLEQAVMEMESNTWKFKDFVHSEQTSEGSAPPCITHTCKIKLAVRSIDESRLLARMDLFFVTSIKYCINFDSPPDESHYVGRNFKYRT